MSLGPRGLSLSPRGLSRLAFLMSAGLKPAAPASPLPPPSGPNASAATYESLMLRWARASGSTHRCLEAQARQPPRSLPLGPFYTIGVEGAGHHMIEAMNTSLCKGHGFRNGSTVDNKTVRSPRRCGGQMSFPSGRKWRT